MDILKILYCLLLPGIFLRATAQDFFSSGLMYGPYKVGFKEIKTIDFGRPSFENRPGNNQLANGRSMQLRIWYPSTVTNQLPVLYKDYIALHLPGKEQNAKAIREIFFYSISELSGDTSLFAPVYEKIINTKTRAFKNAPVKKKIFPLIIYPDNVHAQTILCEWLASQGFIIVSPVIRGTFTSPMEYTLKGIETGVADLQFALGYMRSHFNIKKDFALMGTGFQATIALALQMRNKDAGAMVSLEGGITTGFEDGLMQRTPYFNLQQCTNAMLIIHAPHPDVKPELTYKYKYAERVYQHYPQSSEFYFLNYGLWEKYITNIFPKANKGNTWQSFGYAAVSIKNFLNWKLNGDETGKNKLLHNSFAADIVQTSFRQSALLPPTNEELLSKLKSQGMDGVRKLYHERKTADPQPFSFSSFYQVAQSLIEQASYQQLENWATLFQDCYPLSAIPYSLQGRATLELGKTTASKQHYEKALSLLANDAELSEGEKAFFKPSIENRIKNFN